MVNQLLIKHLKIGVLVISLILTPNAGWTQTRLEAETSYPHHAEVNPSRVATRPRPRPITGTPDGSRTGGGTRPGESASQCRQTTHPPTALVPEDGKGATAMESPVVWFYMPYTNQDVTTVEFSVHDRNETTTLYRSSVQVAEVPGVMGITIPIALEMEEAYQWKLMINCGSENYGHRDFALDGWITRTTPDPAFEWNGVWYDALTELATRYRSNPEDTAVRTAWINLLEQVGLADLALDTVVDAQLLSN
ncbi:DUF928 domain-containing protein [Cyanobacteria bacterium FACHB-471]|nr:DUF928 domain-containing protein [Cyanobacteria bacterium FACHB-471]